MHSPLFNRRRAARGLLTFIGLTTCALVGAEESEKGMSRGGRAKALLIGVSDYNDPAISDLKYSHRDVYALAETLLRSGHYGTEDLIVMTTDQPSAERRPTLYNLQRELAALEEVRGADSLMVYFSGHGGRDAKEHDSFLYPQDVNFSSPDLIPKTSLSVTWLMGALRRMTGFRAQALLMDACRTGPPEQKSLFGEGFGPPRSSRSQSSSASGAELFVVYSTEFDQPSFEDDRLQLGQFTHAIIRGLEGEADGANPNVRHVADDQISVKELQAFAFETLYTQGHRSQRPMLSGEFGQDLIIAPSQPSVAERRRDVRCPVSPKGLVEAATDTLKSYSASEPAEFLRAAERLTWSAECADDLLPIAVIGDLHRVNALRAFLVQDHRTARLAFSTLHAMGLAPLVGVPNVSAALRALAAETPAGGAPVMEHPLGSLSLPSPPSPARMAGNVTYIGHPSGVEVWVNGRLTSERSMEGVAFVQVKNWDGTMQPGAWLRPEQPAPVIESPRADWLRPTTLALGLGAGATALAGAGFLVCNLIHVGSFEELSGDIRANEGLPEDPLASLEDLQRRANTCAVGATVGGALSVGLGAGALGLTIKF